MIQNHIVTFETAKRMWEAGFPQNTAFFINRPGECISKENICRYVIYGGAEEHGHECPHCDQFVAAPLATEILEQISKGHCLTTKRGSNCAEFLAQEWLNRPEIRCKG